MKQLKTDNFPDRYYNLTATQPLALLRLKKHLLFSLYKIWDVTYLSRCKGENLCRKKSYMILCLNYIIHIFFMEIRNNHKKNDAIFYENYIIYNIVTKYVK